MTAPPPSKPDRRFSRIRLSSQWVLLREGAALRLVPKCGDQTFGITQVNCAWLIPPLASPRGHSRWSFGPSFCPSHFHLPASLRSTVVTRFSATTDALTPASRVRRLFANRTHQHWRVSLIIPGGLPAIPSPTICVLTGDRPVASGFFPPRQTSPFARRLVHSRRPNRVHGGDPLGPPVLRTGRSRSVALHPALPRGSYGSIPHGSSPHGSGLPPLCLPVFSGARARTPRPLFSERQLHTGDALQSGGANDESDRRGRRSEHARARVLPKVEPQKTPWSVLFVSG